MTPSPDPQPRQRRYSVRYQARLDAETSATLGELARTFAYVYLSDDTCVNAEIVKQGYGYAYTRFPFKYLEQFRQLEREAREAKRGLWATR